MDNRQAYNQTDRSTLLKLARDSIFYGLQHGRPLQVILQGYPDHLKELRAAFVTLHLEGELRGCIGHLEPISPLLKDVAENAFAAAFRDSRFPPLVEREFHDLNIEISVISKIRPIEFSSEIELLQQIRPGVDGLILDEGGRRGTFLPSVWEQLKTPVEFLRNLKRKAGLPYGHFSRNIKVYRYTTECFSEPPRE